MDTINRFIHSGKGGIAVMFAIMLPLLLSFCALAFDGSRLLTKRARLADALNESALAIATAASNQPDDAEIKQLKVMLDDYIHAYFPQDTLESSDLGVSYADDDPNNEPIFSLEAHVDVKTMLPFKFAPAFSPTVNLSNSGKVRKGPQDVGRAADYVFVVDFSGSMRSASAEPGLARLSLLKKVVKNISEQALEAYPETTFSIVPFELGVPVKAVLVDAKSGLRYPDKNELGGAVPVCSVLMVPNKSYHNRIMDPTDPSKRLKTGFDIDYMFWADKSDYISTQLKEALPSAHELPYTLAEVNDILDYGRYKYYQRYLIPSAIFAGAAPTSFEKLEGMGWCKRNEGVPLNSVTKAPYSCEKPPENASIYKDLSIFTEENQRIIASEIEAAKNVFITSGGTTVGLANQDSTDIEATLAGMFDSNNIILFPRYYSLWNDRQRYQGPFTDMCLSSGHDVEAYPYTNAYDKMAKVEVNAYLIEPTNKLSELAPFQKMYAGGGTDSSIGILRAVPELMKGPNPRKVMIVISDGDDSPLALTDLLHKKRKEGERVCDLIKEGIKSRVSYVEQVDIYFISVVNDASGRSRTKYWADYCTGADNAIVATNYDEIMNKLIEIMGTYEETGYFYN
jgi:tight adherence protein G